MNHAMGSHYGRKRQQRKWKPGNEAAMQELAARTGGELVKNAFHGSHEGVEFRLRLVDQSQRFILSVVCPEAGRFRITRSTRIDRWLASFLPAWPLPSRDTRFDRDMCVQTRDLEVTNRVITDADCRQTIRSLMGGRCNSVVLEDGRVKLIGPRAALGMEPDVDELLALLARLATLGTVVTDFARGHEVRSAPKHDAAKIAAWVAVIALFVLGGATFIVATKLVPLLDASGFIWMNLGLGLAAVPFVAFGLAHLLSQRTVPGRLLLPVFLIALFAIPLASTGTAYMLNGVLDDGRPEFRSAPITRTKTYKHKSTRRYKVGVEAWWETGETRWFSVGRETYEGVRAGGDWNMDMLIRPGAFDQPWIETTTVARDGD